MVLCIKGWDQHACLAASQFPIAAYLWLLVLLWSLICTYGLLRYFSRWLVTIWLKRSVAIASSPNRYYTSSPCNISILEGRGSPTSHRSSVNSETEYVSGILDLPSPTRLHTVSKSTMDDEYHMWKPFACNQPWPLPMTICGFTSSSSLVFF